MPRRSNRVAALAGVLALLAPIQPVAGQVEPVSPVAGRDQASGGAAAGGRPPVSTPAGPAIRFEPNEGQFDPAVDYRVGLGPEEIYLVDGGVVVDRSQGRHGHAVSLAWVGGAADATASGIAPVGGRTSYFASSDPAAWVTGVESYAAVTYRSIYPGIDVDYLGVAGSFRYDLRVAPGADPTPIALAVEGADAAEIAGNGGLVIDRSVGPSLRFSQPLAYQETDDGRTIVDCAYQERPDGSFGFALGDYDPTLELVIDPTLEYSTYVGGGDVDQIHAIAADASGATYATGAAKLTYPTTVGVYQENAVAGFDVVVTKLAADGQSLVYSTYLGGGSDETGFAIAVDAGGNAYVTGETASDDFPTAGPPLDGTRNGVDAFVAKLSADGASLVYSTFLGGDNVERGDGIAVDAAGSAYVVGHTLSGNFPVQNPVDASLDGSQDGFVTQLNPDGSALVYSTYLGGSGNDDANGIVLGPTARAWVTGATTSTDFPTTADTYEPVRGQSSLDVFVGGLAAGGGSIVYGTYLGGTSADQGTAIDIDGTGALYVTGTAQSGFPATTGAWDTGHASGDDQFVAKLDPALTGTAELVYSGFLGGSDTDQGTAIAVDASGRAHVAGRAASTGLATSDGFDQVPSGTDAIVAIISADGTAKLYATYLGGAATDVATGLTLIGAGIGVGGYTDSPDFPLVNAYDSTVVSFDGWLARLTPLVPFVVNSTVDRLDQVVGDGVCDTGFLVGSDPECTLRAAVQEANATGVDEITVPAGTYTVTIPGGDDNAEKGDLDITSNLTISGAGAATTIIQAGTDAVNGIDRVIDVKLAASGSVVISGLTVRYGQESDGAGLRTNSDLLIEDAVVVDNTASGKGAAVFVSGSAASLTVRRTTMTGGSANDGGAIMVKDGSVTIEDSTMAANAASRRGGAIYTDGGTVVVDRTVLDGNSTAGEDGGAINSLKGSVTVTDSTISSNSASRGGGGIYGDDSVVTVERSLLAGNSSGSEDGGAIQSRGGSAVLTLTNSTITGNSAGRDGGGILSDRPASLLNTTVTLNTAVGVGGGLHQKGDTFQLQNTIIAGNLAGGDCWGTFVSLGNNLDGGTSCALTQPSDLSNTDPLLELLQDNGGPTHTHALAASSPAIDTGDDAAAPAVDQRGVARPLDGDGDTTPETDIGAFEYDPASLSPPVAADDSATTTTDTAVTIDVLANDTDADGDPLIVDSVTQGGNGSVANNGSDVTYTPNAASTGVDTFTYTVTDGNGGFDTATVTVTVAVPAGTYLDEFNAVAYDGSDGTIDWSPDPWAELNETTNPTSGLVTVDAGTYCNGGSGGCLRIGAIESSVSGYGAVRQADLTGAVSATLSYTYRKRIIDDVGGTMSVQVSGNGGGSWSPLTSYSMVGGSTGSHVSETFDITAHIAADTRIRVIGSGSTEAYLYFDNIQIEVESGTSPPVAADDSATTTSDTAVTIDVLANDTDADGDPLTVDSVTQGGNGSVVNNGSDVTYTPNAAWTGVDTFTYTVGDGNGGADTATVTVTVHPTTLVVNSTGDTGDAAPGDGFCDTGGTNSGGATECTLRAALEEANASAIADSIHFGMPTSETGHSAGVWTIAPGSGLPGIAASVAIDGSTQPGWTSTPVIELAGTAAGAAAIGLLVTGDGVEIRGLAINRFGSDGILIDTGATGTIIAGNHIGTDADGLVALGNGDRGVELTTGSGPTTVGGTIGVDRNVISGNGTDGIVIWESDGNTVIGNYIGTDVAGNAALPNGADGIALGGTSSNNSIGQPGAGNVLSGNTNDGLELADVIAGNVVHGNTIGLGADGNTIVANGRHGIVLYNGVNTTTVGGAGAGEGNVISGNTVSGLVVDGNANGATTSNEIQGNLIGTDATGTLARGNGAAGVHLFASANSTTIGGAAAGEGNLVSANGGAGILITGAGTDDNAILGNSIAGNGGLAVDLGGEGVTPNDAGDPDPGPNDLLNFPVLTSASELGGVVTVDFQLDVPAGDYRIEFFANPGGADPSGFGEGETFLHGETISHPGGGVQSFSTSVAGSDGDVLTATATVVLTGPAYAATSELSLARLVRSGAFVVNSTGDGADIIIGNGICETATPGECTLRAAIQEANAAFGADAIDFSITAPLVGGAHTITVSAPGLPAITDAVVIDGASEPDFAGTPVIELDGTGTGVGVDGLFLDIGSDGSTIQNLAINRFGRDGIQIWGSDDHVLLGNFVGTDVGGTLDLGNAAEGIRITGQRVVVGGTNAGDGNIIAGNDGNGIRIANGSDDLTIQGNRIGVGSGGESLGNTGHGISFGAFDSTGTLVGGDAVGARNVIAHNGGAGVASSGMGNGNSVLGNSVVDNGGLGIDWNEDGVTANDAGDADTGFNGLLNFPVISRAAETAGLVTVDVDLDVPAGDYRIELFTNLTGADPSGSGEGEVIVHSFTVTHPGGGNQSFSSTLSGSAGDVLTATATLVLAGPSYSSTSEFSPASIVVDGFTATIAGSVLEDVDGDGDVTDDGTGVSGVQVWVFADQGNGVPDNGDPLAATVVTDAAGDWTAVAGGNGIYWVAVDSSDIVPAAGFNASFGIDDVWAEQTYASAGAVTHDGVAYDFTAGDGPLLGGRDPALPDGFPSLADAEHVHRISVAGSDVSGLQTGFSFQVIVNTGDEPDPGAFADASAWVAFDPGAAGVGVDPDGYRGVADDGRYVYFAPYGDGVAYHGEVLRYDGHGPFTDPGSWATFDPGAAGVGIAPVGYAGALFDGRFLYLSPYGNRHGEVLRYDTQGPFAAAGSWATFDPGANGVGADPDGYLGLAWDGRHVYFAPFDNGSGRHGEVLRYDSNGPFTAAGSWATFDPGTAGVGSDPDGYVGAVFDGTYVYFAPDHNGAGHHGEVLRYDTRSAFVAPSAWASFDPGASGVGAIADGFADAVFDGRFVYLVPSQSDAGSHGEVVRYDTAGAFADPGSWAAFDPGAAGVGLDPDGYRGGTFDGRFVHLAPSDNGSGAHGEVLRFDTAGTFADGAAWSTFDPGAAGVGVDPVGYSGAVFDGRFVLFSPAERATGAHGEVLRFDTAGEGQGSLRQFIANANAIIDAQTSRFAIPTTDPGHQAAPLHYTIRPVADLPAITDAVDLDATTQPGFAGAPVVQLDGSTAGPAPTGLTIDATSTTVRGFVVNRFATGVSVAGGADNAIAGNYLGPDVTGMMGEVGNSEEGIRIAGATGTIIGGADAADRNVISGNRLRGVFVDDFSDGPAPVSDGTTIVGNYIGVDSAGSASLPFDGSGATQQIGIALWDGPGNSFGGPGAGESNVISGNDWYGIYLWGPNATVNRVQGNVIGLDASGTSPVGNGADDPATRAGVYLSNAPGNLVGGTGSGEGNVIAGNDANGVVVHNAGAIGNSVVGNTIYGNAGIGIDLGMDAVTTNDPLDGDTGANDRLNYPELSSAAAVGGEVSLEVTVDVPAGDYRLEFFANPSGTDPSGHGEGEVLLHADLVSHPGGGPQRYTVSLAGAVGDRLTATATESLGGGALGSTSEFSPYALVTAAGSIVPDASIRRSDLREAGTVPTAPGIAGNGYAFSGGADRLAGPAVDVVSNQLTLSAWVNPGTLGADRRVLAKADGPAVYELVIDGDTPVGRITASGSTAEVRGGTVAPGGWHQLAALWDGVTLVLYVDGVAVDSAPVAGALDTDLLVPVAVGNRAAADRGFDGTIDHVWIGHRTWTGERLATAFTNLSDPASFVTIGGPQTGVPGAWTVSSTVSRSGANALQAPSTASGSAAWATAVGLDEPGVEFEAWWRLSDPGSVEVAGGSRTGAVPTDQNETGLVAGVFDLASLSNGARNQDAVSATGAAPGTWVKVVLRTDETGTSTLSIDDVAIIGPTPHAFGESSGSVGLRVGQLPIGLTWHVDDVQLRRFVSDEPVATLGPLDRN